MKVIVIALRSCPTAFLGPYGNEWVATPTFDRLAADGVVFDRHIARIPEATKPTCPGFPELVGRARTVLVNHTRATMVGDGWDVIVAVPPTEPEVLRRDLPAILDRLADVPDWLLWIESDALTPPWDARQDVFEEYVDDLIEAAEGETIEPWDDPPTGPFDCDDEAAWELLHRSAATAVTTFDGDLSRIFDLLRSRGLHQSAIWAFTAGSGWPLGEHGFVGPHRPWLHEELVHLPLIVRFPHGSEAGRRVSALTQPSDFLAAVAGWLGAERSGPSLRPLLHGEAEAIRPHAVSHLEAYGAEEWALRTPEWGFLLPVRVPDGEVREPQLFAKPEDDCEVNDLRPRNVELAEELEAKLRGIIAGPSG